MDDSLKPVRVRSRTPVRTKIALAGWFLLILVTILGALVRAESGQASSFQPTTSSPAQSSTPPIEEAQAFSLVDGQPEHRIGPGDVLTVTAWTGDSLESQRLKVAEDGTLFIPFGINRNLKALGFSSSELKRRIREQLQQVYRQPEVQVVIEEYNANRAYLLGEVRTGGPADNGPGLYSLEGRKTVLEFIIDHGGFTEEANITSVQVNRASGEVVTVNLSDVIFGGDERQNVVVQPGDIVWVPSREIAGNTYFVFGEVNNPGIIQTQEDLSVVELVARAGSLTRDASREGVYVIRGELGNPEIIRVDFEKLLEQADFSQVISLRDGDMLYATRSGAAKFRDVMSAISPVLGLLRDTVFLFEVRD